MTLSIFVKPQLVSFRYDAKSSRPDCHRFNCCTKPVVASVLVSGSNAGCCSWGALFCARFAHVLIVASCRSALFSAVSAVRLLVWFYITSVSRPNASSLCFWVLRPHLASFSSLIGGGGPTTR